MSNDFNRSMNGGKKRKWLRENRKQVLWIANNLGEDECCRIFNMKRSTLERLGLDELSSSDYQWTKSDKAVLIAKTAETGVEELKDELAELDPVKDFHQNVMMPFLKLCAEYYDKLTAPERERRELLKVALPGKTNQPEHGGDNLYVM